MSSRITLFSYTPDVGGLPEKAVAMQKSQSRAIETGHKKQDGIEDNVSHRTACHGAAHRSCSELQVCVLRHPLGICNVMF